MKRITNIKPYEGTVVYRLYDKQRHLIYVGSSNNYVKRIRSHLMNQSWWHEIYYYDIICVEESERFELERFHINQLDPEYNVMWKRDDAPPSRDISILASESNIKKYVYKPKNKKFKKSNNKFIYFKNGATIKICENYYLATIIKKDGNKSSIKFNSIDEARNWINHAYRSIRKKN